MKVLTFDSWGVKLKTIQKENGGFYMKKWIALVCSCMLLFAGCTTKQEGTAGSGQPATDDSVKANELTVAVGAQFTTLDPALNSELINGYVMQHTYSTLFTKDEENNLIPDLAESCEISEDGLTYTVKLKEGIEWSDGVPLTAEHFRYGIVRALTYGAENAWSIYNLVTYLDGAAAYESDDTQDAETLQIPGVQAVDDTTLVFQLIKPCAFFKALLNSYAFMPVRADFAPQHDSTWSFTPGYPSVGPYTLEECNENDKIIVAKNENYYRADEITLDKITFQVMTDMDAQALAFKNNDIDIALRVNSTLPLTYENKDELWKVESPSNYFLVVNSGPTGPEWMQDVRVRRALALAIDKEALVTAVGDPSYYVPLDGYVPNGLKGSEKDFRTESDEKEKLLEYDPEEAKNLLKEAGYDESNPLKITYKYSQTTLHADVAAVLQGMWKSIGVECDLEVVESGVYYNQIFNGDFEIARYGYTASDDPSQFLTLWTTTQQQTPAVDDPEYDKMMDAATYIVDYNEYMEALHNIEHYLVQENVYVIPLFNYGDPMLKKTYVQNTTHVGATPFYGYCTIEK